MTKLNSASHDNVPNQFGSLLKFSEEEAKFPQDHIWNTVRGDPCLRGDSVPLYEEDQLPSAQDGSTNRDLTRPLQSGLRCCHTLHHHNNIMLKYWLRLLVSQMVP